MTSYCLGCLLWQWSKTFLANYSLDRNLYIRLCIHQYVLLLVQVAPCLTIFIVHDFAPFSPIQGKISTRTVICLNKSLKAKEIRDMKTNISIHNFLLQQNITTHNSSHSILNKHQTTLSKLQSISGT